MDLADVFLALRQRWAIVLAAVLLGVGIAWVTSPEETPAPERVATGYVATQVLLQEVTQTTSIGLPLLAALAANGEIPARVAASVGLDIDPATFASQVELTPDIQLGILRITYRGSDREEVSRVVRGFGDEILRFAAQRNSELREQAVQQAAAVAEARRERVDALNAQLTALGEEDRRRDIVQSELDAMLSVYGRDVQRLQDLQATSSDESGLVPLGLAEAVPMSTVMVGEHTPARTTRVAAAALVTALLGMVLAVLLGLLDPRVRSRRQAEAAFGVPVVADIPVRRKRRGAPDAARDAYGRLAVAALHGSPWSLTPRGPGEHFETVSLRRSRASAGRPRTVLLTSPTSREDRVTTLANVAEILAAAGRRVLLVDAVGDGTAGIVGLLRAEDDAGSSSTRPAVRPSRLPGVFLAAGDEATAMIADRSAWAQVSVGVDMILVDGGALLTSATAGMLAVDVDAVLLVAANEVTTRRDAKLTRDLLLQLGANLLGLALLTSRGHHILTRRRPVPEPTFVPASEAASEVHVADVADRGGGTEAAVRSLRDESRHERVPQHVRVSEPPVGVAGLEYHS